MTNKQKLSALFGFHRSGTTWLGSIINTSPEIAYRFEPFHRRQNKPEISGLVDKIKNNVASDEDLEKIYECLLPSYAEWNKPPFFDKENEYAPLARSLMWPIAKKNTSFNSLFTKVYTPKDRVMICFKEVHMTELLMSLVFKIEAPVIYLLRHPCAVINSLLKGKSRNLMTFSKLSLKHREKMREADPALFDRFEGKFDRLSDLESYSLLWIADTTYVYKKCIEQPNFMLVIYEDLAANTLDVTKKTFAHLGIELKQTTIDFVNNNQSKSLVNRIVHGQIFQKEYFSIFKNSTNVSNRWKDDLDEETIESIMSIVEKSFIYQEITKLGYWA